MPILAWFSLISLSFIAILAATSLLVYLVFFANDGKSMGAGVFIFLIVATVTSIIFGHLTGSPLIQAALIAGSILVSLLGLALHFLLPNVDNKDLIVALRPLVLISFTSGLAVFVFNLLKIFIAPIRQF